MFKALIFSKLIEKKNWKSESGFTLFEVLIYSAILAIFLGASFAFISSILGSADSLIERNEVLANQEFIERKIVWLVSYAEDIASPAAGSSSTSGFTIRTSSSSLNPAVFSRKADKITLSLAGEEAIPLTNNRVKVKDFLAEHITASSSPPVLRVYFELQSTIYKNIVATTTLNYVIR